MKNIRIVIGGPPDSGKSVFAIYLQRALRQLEIRTYHYDYDPYSPTRQFALGEISAGEREKMKGPVSKEDAKAHAKKFKENYDEYPIIVGDLPGQISETTEILAKSGTHGIIVCDEKKFKEIDSWKSMFDKLNIKTICIVQTNLRGDEDIDDSGEIINAKISNLDRNNMVDHVPATILVLAQKIKIRLSL